MRSIAAHPSSPKFKYKKLQEVSEQEEMGNKSVSRTSLESAANNDDEERLKKLGYEQNLPRQFSLFQTFGLVLTNCSVIIGILSCIHVDFLGVVPLFSVAMQVGGPMTFVWGWVLTSVFTCMTALCLSEIVSAYPTAGGLYYYSAKLSSGHSFGPLAAFTTAWLNALGQIAGTAGSVYAGATFFNITLYLISSRTWDWIVTDERWVFTTFLVMMVLGGVANSFGGSPLKMSAFISVMIHTVGIFVLLLVLLIVAPVKQSPSYVLTTFRDETGWTSMINAPPIFVFALGLLPSAWSQIGFDSSAHLSEETHSAHLNGPRAIMLTVGSAIVTGLALILCFLFCIQNLEGQELEMAQFANHLPVQIVYDAGGPILAILFSIFVALAGFLCGVGTIAANSRMLYAFARDGGLPFSDTLVVLNEKTKMPTRLVWVSVLASVILIVPSLFSSTVLNAVSGLSIIGFTSSYAIPIFLRITVGQETFEQAEFNLGKWSTLVGSLSIAWIAFLFIVFQFPNAAPAFPVTLANFNFVPAVLFLLVIFIGSWWMLDARYWFKGPQVQFSGE